MPAATTTAATLPTIKLAHDTTLDTLDGLFRALRGWWVDIVLTGDDGRTVSVQGEIATDPTTTVRNGNRLFVLVRENGVALRLLPVDRIQTIIIL